VLVVNTLNPNGVVDDFIARIRAAERRSDVEYAAVPRGDKHKLARQRGVVSDLAFRLGGELELFQHRWHIAVISKEPATFVAGLQKRLDEAVKNLPGHGLVPGLANLHLAYPSRLTADQIETLLDGNGWNITFTTLDAWQKAAGKDFTSRYRAAVGRVANAPEDACVLELVKATRNFIAHGSDKSRREFNACVAPRSVAQEGPGLTGNVNSALARGTVKSVRSVGVYLQGRATPGASRRISALTDRLAVVAAQLKV